MDHESDWNFQSWSQNGARPPARTFLVDYHGSLLPASWAHRVFLKSRRASLVSAWSILASIEGL